MQIRDYQNSDYVEIADLFHDSVHAISTSFYSRDELEAWAPTPTDYNFWQERLSVKKPFVALKDEKIVGFIELEADGHIDCLYVHKNYQGEGIASKLLQHIQDIALTQGIHKLHVEASKVAKPLFEKHGFALQRTNTVNLRGQSLINYIMLLNIKPQ